jgi:hypothetical protein
MMAPIIVQPGRPCPPVRIGLVALVLQEMLRSTRIMLREWLKQPRSQGEGR